MVLVDKDRAKKYQIFLTQKAPKSRLVQGGSVQYWCGFFLMQTVPKLVLTSGD